MILQRLALRAVAACALAATAATVPAIARQSTVILICPSAVPPDHCTRETATDVIIGMNAATPFGCLMGGLTTLARHAEGEAFVDRYAMTRCEGRPD